jgi:hypothetical protein
LHQVRKLWLTTTYTTCKRCITILRLHLPAYWTKLILRIIQLYIHVICRDSNSILNHSNNIYWIRPTVRTNTILRCNSNYKSSPSNPTRRKGNLSVSIARIRSRHCHTHTILCTALPNTICNRSNRQLSLNCQRKFKNRW